MKGTRAAYPRPKSGQTGFSLGLQQGPQNCHDTPLST